MKFFGFTKKILFYVAIYTIIFEILFQIFFFFNLNFIKQPILFYNGYCDQNYWNLYNKKTKIGEDVSYHPILSYKKNEVFIPNKFIKNYKINSKELDYNKISLYGSSYINHDHFKNVLNNYRNIEFKNYALESYGLDQIYLSYKLTSHLNQNKVIILGFLLEDLDRSMFYFRDYQKAYYTMDNNEFRLNNIPVKQNAKVEEVKDFYLYRFLKNFYELLLNDFDPRSSKCHMQYKRKLFDHFFKDIQMDAKKFNQEIFVITFNSKKDLIENTNWRYEYIKNYFKKNNITHIDSLEIMKKKLSKKNENLDDYFGTDGHNTKKSFHYIFDKFIKLYK